MSPEPFIYIHPEAATELGIQSGDRVLISSETGGVVLTAKRSADTRKDCLKMIHGFAHANINMITSLNHPDPLSGFPWMRALPVKIEKIR